MENNLEKNLNLLNSLGLFKTSDATAAGISQPTLSRLAASGKITRLAHGLYLHPNATIDPAEIDFAIACTKFGKLSAIGGLSALFRHRLISQVPEQIWVIVSPSSKSSSRLYRCIRTQNDPSIGVDDHHFYRITNIERSIVEAFQFATKMGLEIAISSARQAIAHSITTDNKLHEMAKCLGTQNTFIKHWEAIVAE